MLGGVVLARCGSVGFDGLAGLDSMVAGLASVVVGLVELKGMDLGSCGSLKTEGYGS